MLALLLTSLLSFSMANQRVNGPYLNQQLSMSKQKHMGESFPIPEVVHIDSYDWLKIENCSYISKPGQPMLPVKSLVSKLPEGSSVTSTKVEVNESYLRGSFKVVPAPFPVIAGMEASPRNFSEDPNIYNSSNIFPEEWYVCRYTHGLDPETMTRVEYIVINFYPLRFLPAEKEVLRAESVSVTIDYVEAVTLAPLVKLRNLIITSDTLEPYAVQLAKYKNDTGISSKVLNTTWIYEHYAGIDSQEKIRNCIKDFAATYGIVYVTIFGDADQVPVRLAYVPDGQDTYTPTDLYYADLDGTWDDNHDGLYADQRYDNVDGIPDVYVGRIPPSLIEYAQTAVNKIKGYQQEFNASKSWTRRVVLAAGTGSGDGLSNPFGIAFPFLKNYTANINTNKDIVKLYEAYGNLSTGSIASEINRGALFVNFAGHGDPGLWLFYWVIPLIWYNGYGITDVQALTNGLKLPVVTTMACSTARFDDQDCIGEWFVLEPNGGSIAYFGATRIAWGYTDQWVTTGLMGEMDWRIYQNFYEGFTRLGGMWGQSVREYVQNHIWNYKNAGVEDVKTFMEFVLLGDPTLRIYNPNYPETLKVPEDFPTIQSAINAAYDGDKILVSSGTYYENLVVNKSLSLVGQDKRSTIIDGSLTGNVLDITACNVEVTGFTIRRSGTTWQIGSGIFVCERSTGNSISGNIITGNTWYGINLYPFSGDNNISGNSVAGSHYGITLQSSDNNSIVGNNLTGNSYGIYVGQSSNNTLRNNTMAQNSYNFGLQGWSLSDLLNDVDVSNTVDGKPIYYWINDVDKVVPADAGCVILVNCTRITVQDLHLTRNGLGVELAFTTNSTIVKNNMTNNGLYGIYMYSSSKNSLIENNVADNYIGIEIGQCSNNRIAENSISNNYYAGILIQYSLSNFIIGNNIIGNKYGFWLGWSTNNSIYHNNFISNTNQTYNYDLCANIWDNGYPHGGNYWSNLTDVDIHSGPYQNETGNDAIWDHPYLINAKNTDRYPLAIPWTPNLEWDISLTASSKEGYSDISRFGVRIGSTAGFDKTHDAVDPPAPVAGVVSYFWYLGNPSSPADLRKLSKSMIPPSDNLAWTYKVRPVGIDGTMVINWTAKAVTAIPPEYNVLLLDSAGTAVADMRKVTQYSFTAEPDTTYSFAIRVFIGHNFSLHLAAGWNMVSFPVIPTNTSFSNIFSGIGYYQVVAWDGTKYVAPSNAEAGRGYWVLVLAETTMNITNGVPVDQYELDLPAGWSMIGSIYNCTASATLVFPEYYQLVTWDGTKYVDSATIEPGRGYWVLVLTPTHIVVDESRRIHG